MHSGHNVSVTAKFAAVTAITIFLQAAVWLVVYKITALLYIVDYTEKQWCSAKANHLCP